MYCGKEAIIILSGGEYVVVFHASWAVCSVYVHVVVIRSFSYRYAGITTTTVLSL